MRTGLWRLWISLSLLWLLGAATYVAFDYFGVEDGAVFFDLIEGDMVGVEIPGSIYGATKYVPELVVMFNWSKLLAFFVVPPVLSFVLFICVDWVVSGFKEGGSN